MGTKKRSHGNQHKFAEIPKAEIQRSKFDRSHGYKTTMGAGHLIPIFVDEALPGDTFSMRPDLFGRLSTPIVPIMDNMYLDTFWFSVPYRLVWENFQKFNGEQENPGDSTEFLIPQITSSDATHGVGSIYDYMGIPPLPSGHSGEIEHSALPLRAFNLIFNEWFRSQDLVQSLPVPKDDGPDDPTTYKIVRRGKRHDYFTSGMPWPQKGPAVELPLGGTAPVTLDNQVINTFGTGSGIPSFSAGGSTVGNLQAFNDQNVVLNSTGIPGDNTDMIWQNPNMGIQMDGATGVADLSAATAATINTIRQAFQVQRLFERDARGGTRYTEIIRAHFLVSSPDARLQRPEYLGGGSTRLQVSPVAQTTPSNIVPDTTPQGNLAGYSTVSSQSGNWTHSFTEHCIVIGLVNLRADLNYQQGLDRMWSRKTRFDHFWPALSHLGEESIFNQEIYATGESTDLETFAYQERYASYRYKPSQITGEFRSEFAQSRDIWHLGQDFANLPTLNQQFIEDNPPFQRIMAVQDGIDLLLDVAFNFQCARPMSLYGVPGLIDHF